MMLRPLLAAVLIALAAPAVGESTPETWDGLVEVRSRRLDAAFLAPGVDFRPYTKVLLEPTEAAFQRNWLRDVNSNRGGRRVTDADAQRILEAAQTNFSDVFAEAFTRAGYQVVTEPGPDVLKLRSAVIDLFLNAPDTMSAARVRSFTVNAGQATMVLEARDSTTNALLARVLDRRETVRSPGQATSVSNLADFRLLFRDWGRVAVQGVDNLKAHSPIPDPLTPGQRLD
jgi:hypothetical protein